MVCLLHRGASWGVVASKRSGPWCETSGFPPAPLLPAPRAGVSSDLVAEVLYTERRGRKTSAGCLEMWRKGKEALQKSQAVDVTMIMNPGQSSPWHLKTGKTPGRKLWLRSSTSLFFRGFFPLFPEIFHQKLQVVKCSLRWISGIKNLKNSIDLVHLTKQSGTDYYIHRWYFSLLSHEMLQIPNVVPLKSHPDQTACK